MSKSNTPSPYENNSYLKNDEEVLKEVLFFQKFGLNLEKESSLQNQDGERNEDAFENNL